VDHEPARFLPGPGVPEAVEIPFWWSIIEGVEHFHNNKLLYLLLQCCLCFKEFSKHLTFDVVGSSELQGCSQLGFKKRTSSCQVPASAE